MTSTQMPTPGSEIYGSSLRQRALRQTPKESSRWPADCRGEGHGAERRESWESLLEGLHGGRGAVTVHSASCSLLSTQRS